MGALDIGISLGLGVGGIREDTDIFSKPFP